MLFKKYLTFIAIRNIGNQTSRERSLYQYTDVQISMTGKVGYRHFEV